MFNTIIEAGKQEGLKVFSAIRVQCPVLVVHLKMDSRDNDPFFPVDRSILSLYDNNHGWKIPQVAKLIGLDESFIHYRVDSLQSEGMLENLDGTKFSTDAAKRKYFNEDGERPIVTIYGDLVLDGYSLKPLDKEFYATKAPYSNRRSEMIVPRVILGNDDPDLVHAVHLVEKSNGRVKECYQLEHDSFNYQIEGVEEKSIDNVYVVLAFDTITKKGVRKVFFKDRFLSKVDSLEGTLDKYYIYMRDGEFHSSGGYMPRDGDPLSTLKDDSIRDFLCERYEMDVSTEQDYILVQQLTDGTPFPFTVIVNEKMLERSENPCRLLDDAIRGGIVDYTREGTFKNRIGGFVWIPVKNIIPEYLAHYKALRNWQKEKGRVDISFIRSVEPAWPTWRIDFIRLGLLNELEAIDISQFIDENREKEIDL